ncbi:hypothetical protein [Sinorhizobium meliloti]|uniref:hypothetical protein n=1 Tax=Rhizobium meliloti TaxID=382 RepID=UPI001297BAD9|nr:hypothetical protein [Sinorhizobium meliloti]MQX56566.1 hypothetical protein [Sinorhizobium meliloti]
MSGQSKRIPVSVQAEEHISVSRSLGLQPSLIEPDSVENCRHNHTEQNTLKHSFQ